MPPESAEAVVERLLEEPACEIRQPTAWHVVAAIYGRGSLLVGPLVGADGGRAEGAVAVAPPGTFLRTPSDMEEPLSRTGWRLATWAGGVRLDQHRPVATRRLTLAETVAYLGPRAPEQGEWLRATVRSQLDVLIGLSRPDGRRRLSGEADRASRALNALVAAATQAFGDSRELAYVEAELRGDRELFLRAARSLADAGR